MSFTFRGHAELVSASLGTSITISSKINLLETLKRPRKLSGQGDVVILVLVSQFHSHAELVSASLGTSITNSSNINLLETLKRPRKLSGQGDGVL